MIRFIFGLVLLAFSFLPAATPANAACGGGASNCYVSVAGGAWATGTFVDTNSSGVSCGCLPASTDIVVFDSGSGNLTSVTGNPTIGGLDASAASGATFTHSASQTLAIGGNTFTLGSGLTYTISNPTSSILKFSSTSGTTLITTAGKTLPALQFDGVGGTFQFQDALTNNGGLVTLTNGALNTNSQTVSTGGFSSTNSNTRSVTLGTSAWTLTPASGISAWDITTSTNMTMSAASATFNIVQTNASASVGVSFIFGGACTGCNSYGTINIGARSSTQQAGVALTTTTPTTIATLNITAPNNIRIPNSVTTVTNALTWNGSTSNPIFVSFFGSGGTSSNQLTASASSSINGVVLRGVNFSGTVNATNCIDLGNSTITSCAVPSGGGGGHIIGG